MFHLRIGFKLSLRERARRSRETYVPLHPTDRAGREGWSVCSVEKVTINFKIHSVFFVSLFSLGSTSFTIRFLRRLIFQAYCGGAFLAAYLLLIPALQVAESSLGRSLPGSLGSPSLFHPHSLSTPCHPLSDGRKQSIGESPGLIFRLKSACFVCLPLRVVFVTFQLPSRSGILVWSLVSVSLYWCGASGSLSFSSCKSCRSSLLGENERTARVLRCPRWGICSLAGNPLFSFNSLGKRKESGGKRVKLTTNDKGRGRRFFGWKALGIPVLPRVAGSVLLWSAATRKLSGGRPPTGCSWRSQRSQRPPRELQRVHIFLLLYWLDYVSCNLCLGNHMKCLLHVFFLYLLACLGAYAHETFAFI